MTPARNLTPTWIPKMILDNCKGNIEAIASQCDTDEWFASRIDLLLEGGSRHNDPEVESSQEDGFAASCYQMLCMGGPAMAGQFTVFAKPKRVAVATSANGARNWIKVIAIALADSYAAVTKDQLADLILDLESHKGDNDYKYGNAGVPKNVVELARDGYSDDLAIQVFHAYGSHSKLVQTSDNSFNLRAVDPTGKVMVADKDGNPKECGVSFGVRVGSLQALMNEESAKKKAKSAKAAKADTSIPPDDTDATDAPE